MGAFRFLPLVFVILWGLVVSVPQSWGQVKPHRDVWLKNEQGERITPEQSSFDAYSPKQTCGGCHPYSTITSGFHFQQGFDQMSDGYDSRRPWILSPGMYGKW